MRHTAWTVGSLLALGAAALGACGSDPAPPADAGASTDAGDAGLILDASADARSPIDPSEDAELGAQDSAVSEAGSDDDAGGEARSFSVLSYNVAGLPEGISGSTPSVNTPLISPKLNAFDVVAVQEDFAYHMQLISAVEHAYITQPEMGASSLGDGLQVLSRFPIGEVARSAWEQCFGLLDSGSDCLTPKGFLRARITLEGGAEVDVYDVHMDAGNAAGDLPVRADNFRQLRASIAEHSEGRAVIVLGDFNERYGAASGSLQTLLGEASLRDVWAELYTGGVVPEPNAVRDPCPPDPNTPECERIDKILVRGSAEFELVPREYVVEGARFVTEAGEQLSDHRPVSARFELSPR